MLYPIFVTINGDIYVGFGNTTGQVNKWTSNTNTSVPVMYINSLYYGLFVDINDTLYCSIRDQHQVVNKWLNDNTTTSTTIAGTGSASSGSNTLNQPHGIFVDINFDLYVVDTGNNRIQLFKAGQVNGSTIAGSGAQGTITLNSPRWIALDANKYLYIQDQGNDRVIGSGPNGFYCLFGCSGSGSSSNQLFYPQSMAFDSFGNIFVTDSWNNRIQKFAVQDNLCS